MVCEFKIMCEIEVWELNEAWKELDKVHGKFWKKLMGILSCAAKGFTEMEQ
jgi:hypothetical protein